MSEEKFVERIVRRDKNLEDNKIKKIETFDVFTNGDGNYYNDKKIDIIVYDDGNISISNENQFTYVYQDQLGLLKEAIDFAEKIKNDK